MSFRFAWKISKTKVYVFAKVEKELFVVFIHCVALMSVHWLRYDPNFCAEVPKSSLCWLLFLVLFLYCLAFKVVFDLYGFTLFFSDRSLNINNLTIPICVFSFKFGYSCKFSFCAAYFIACYVTFRDYVQAC